MKDAYKILIDTLIHEGYLKTPAVIQCFRAVDRADFVPERYTYDAYVNAPLPIGQGQTISQPLTVAFMIELLAPQKGESILEVGFGSGWQTAILAHLVGDSGKVTGIEIIPELFEFGKKNLEKCGYKNLTLVLSDGSKGLAEYAPYDKIIAGAAAEQDIPSAWKDELKIGGRIVAPLRDAIVVIEKKGKEQYETKEYHGFRFVPLVEKK